MNYSPIMAQEPPPPLWPTVVVITALATYLLCMEFGDLGTLGTLQL